MLFITFYGQAREKETKPFINTWEATSDNESIVIPINEEDSYSQVLTINVSENNFGIDESNSLIVSRIQNIDNYTNTGQYDEIVITLGESSYNFTSIPNSIDYANFYLVTDNSTSKEYKLYFTPLPIILIDSENTIVDEPKVLANFTYADEEQVIVSNIGIEIRGRFSQSFPKKTYDMEFWDDASGDETNDQQFGALRSDDDWILDALYNEPLRLRSYVANKLWLEVHTPHYIDDESKAKSGSDVMYVELFLNGKYNGLYNLQEQIDRKQLKLKKFKDDNIRGELYKGTLRGAATYFSITSLPNYDHLPDYDNESRVWSGYEYKYPTDDDVTDWENLYQFTDFVINSSGTDFTDNIWSKFDRNNFIDYYLFLNLIRVEDNTGKNFYLAKYKANAPYFYVPWDLDAVLGTYFDGRNKNVTSGILGNGLIDRVISLNPDDVAADVVNKWSDYRKNIFSYEYLSNFISEQYTFLQTNKIYERESLVYSNFSFDNKGLSYILTWLESRLAYLDAYFGIKIDTHESTSPFITTWETTEANESITIPTYLGRYNYTVDWGDNTTDDNIYTASATHTYADPGIHTVTVRGDFSHIRFGLNETLAKKIRTIEKWGDNRWTSMESAFAGCKNLTINAKDAPNLSRVKDMSSMFSGSSFTADLSKWDVSNVTDMSFMFYGSSFTGELSNWDVSNVTNMALMFFGTSFTGDLSKWDVSSVTSMFGMFEGSSFNQDISDWNVSGVTGMTRMFREAGFNRDISDWDISSVTNMTNMFLDNSVMSSENYDKLLIGWSTLDEAAGETRIPSGIRFHAPDKYSCRGKAGRDVLTDTHSWTITGDELIPIRTEAAALPAVTSQCEVTAANLTEPTAKSSCKIGEGMTVTAAHDVNEFPITESTLITWTYTHNSKSIVQTQAVIIDDTIGPTVTGTLTEVTAQCPINDATELTKPPTPADTCN
ncbi:MAG: BspA family leucine-rich repeat surface protein, partial [Ekhidna sp.]|nr:BspA family leucine-rich repeat surface protein [Ekhidna sp.]